MTTPLIGRPELALASDYEGTRVVLPRLAGAGSQRRYDMALVGPAEGDDYPLAFFGTGRNQTFPLSVRYSKLEHDEMADLVALLELAFTSPDHRLVLRTNAWKVAGLDEVSWIVVGEWGSAYAGGRAWDVTMQAQRVLGSAEDA